MRCSCLTGSSQLVFDFIPSSCIPDIQYSLPRIDTIGNGFPVVVVDGGMRERAGGPDSSTEAVIDVLLSVRRSSRCFDHRSQIVNVSRVCIVCRIRNPKEGSITTQVDHGSLSQRFDALTQCSQNMIEHLTHARACGNVSWVVKSGSVPFNRTWCQHR